MLENETPCMFSTISSLLLLVKKVKDLWDIEAEIEEMKLVERYVCKYFFKLKMKKKLK